VALSSGTAALHLALEILGAGRGDEVITSTLTFAATANAICYVGATPVFVDVSPETWNLDPDLLDEELATVRGMAGAWRGDRRRSSTANAPTTAASKRSANATACG
jgi:aspartate/methionine/tyrosine aminotransferase